MDTRTGEIKELTEEQIEALSQREKKYLMPLSNENVNELRGMNRAQRRAWAKAERKRQRVLSKRIK